MAPAPALPAHLLFELMATVEGAMTSTLIVTGAAAFLLAVALAGWLYMLAGLCRWLVGLSRRLRGWG
jgi:type IV secretory pathway TrbD component